MKKVTWNPNKEEREIAFLYQFFIGINNRGGRGNRQSSMPGIDGMADMLGTFIYDVVENNPEGKGLVDELNKLKVRYNEKDLDDPLAVKNLMCCVFNIHCLSSERFDWITLGNDRLCNFILAILTSSTQADNRLKYHQALVIEDDDGQVSVIDGDVYEMDSEPEIDVFNDARYSRRNVYRKFNLPRNVSDNQGKIKIITRFFDLWDVELSDKEKQMSIFEGKWHTVKNSLKMITWINNHPEVTEWAWDYTFKVYLKHRTPAWLDLSSPDKVEQVKLKRIAMITLYDLLSVEHRKILMASLTKNGAQQKYRSKSDNRKVSSIPLSEERKNMLKKIAVDSNRKIYQVVESMIEQEYHRLYSNQLD